MSSRFTDQSSVYGPAEDSSLLAAAVIDHIRPTDRVLDLGTGSGYIAQKIRAETGATVIGADLNRDACRVARSEGIATVQTDLVDGFRNAVFDVVVFNPPYLPELPESDLEEWFDQAVTGGPTGRELIDRFLRKGARVIRPGGTVFLLISSLTGIAAVRETARAAKFDSEIIAEDAYPGETLAVLKLE